MKGFSYCFRQSISSEFRIVRPNLDTNFVVDVFFLELDGLQ